MRKSIVNVLAMSMFYAANTGAASGNLAEKPEEVQAPGEAEQVEEAAEKTVVAGPTEKKKTAQEIWEEKLVATSLTVNTTPKAIDNKDLLVLADKEAKEFRKIGEGLDKLTTSSAERYAIWAEIFPVRNNIDGVPDIKRFVDQIWNVIPPKYKTAGKKPGEFLPCTSASKERNQTAKGLQTMAKWCQRNSDTLFAHLGVKPVDEDAKALHAVANAVTKVRESAYIPDWKLVLLTEEGEEIPLTFLELLDKFKQEYLKPELDKDEAAKKAFREANKAKLDEADKQRSAK